MINKYIKALVEYGIKAKLIQEEDRIYTLNRLLELFCLEEYEDSNIEELSSLSLEDILAYLLDYAYESGILKENSIVYRDLFDTKIMGILVDRPSTIIKKFYDLYQEDPKLATDYYYKLSMNSDYIRRYRIKKDIKWVTKTKYGDLDITINLSKPEKDPKAIAAAKLKPQSGYPKCLLCKENEGYEGRVDHPARQNHRIIPIEINNTPWGFQYSPYVYYNEHCIVFNKQHTPMKIEKATFQKLFDFVKLFPHYFVGSNADLPIVGGSILSHDHFQGGKYDFAMAKAKTVLDVTIKGFEAVKVGIVDWPMSVLRLSGRNEEAIIELGDHILSTWRNYTDEEAFIYAYSTSKGELLTKEEVFKSNPEVRKEFEAHNTITPIARKNGDNFELDLVLRNNVTSKEHPFGVYHPHEELHHIKKENIGLIEVMGLAVLPARLKEEMEHIKEYMLLGKDVENNESLAKHATWVKEIRNKYEKIDENNIDSIIEDEVGAVFLKVLEHAGVYKRDEEGTKFFKRFIERL